MRRGTIPKLVLGLAALWSAPARASEEFPGAIQEAAQMPCVPQCALCHGVNPGTATTYRDKALGLALFMAEGGILPHDAVKLKSSYVTYSKNPANAAAVTALKNGIDPQTGDSLCGPSYGCGAHVAKKAPPTDLAAPLWVLGAVVAGALLRRRKSTTP